jgi:signal transduction histidine kinase
MARRPVTALEMPSPSVSRSIRDMTRPTVAALPAGFPAGWVRWLALGVFAALAGVGLLPLHPSPVPAAVAAAVAIAAAALLLAQRRPLPLYAVAATAAIAVLGYGTASNVGWFAVCLVAAWCALVARRSYALAYWAAMLIFFAVEWIWLDRDQGWGAWMAGTTLALAAGLLIRHQLDLVRQLREAQAGLAERTRAEERNRIGRELHDVIAHTLTVTLLHISSARLAVEHDPADAARALAEAERLGRESLDEVRQVVGILHPRSQPGTTFQSGTTLEPGMAPLPSVDGLPALAERFRSAGANVTLTVEGDVERLPATTGLAVYRIVQEALTNAVKHAPAAATVARLTVQAGVARLTVDSAGRPGTGTGLGIVSMRERAESLGGQCEAGPGGSGWLVSATFPLAARRRGGAI